MYQIEVMKEAILPRERLLALGAENLSNQELLAIILRTGTRKDSVQALAGQLLSRLGSIAELKHLSIQELQLFPGIGEVKALELKAMLELAHRVNQAELTKLDQVLSSRDLAKRMMLELGDKKQEHLVALYLDSQNRIIRQEVVFIGSVRRSVAEPREILYHACKTLATSIIIVHNHPSGSCQPSQQDVSFTTRLKRACDDLGVVLLDHLIVGKKTYYSFREEKAVLD